MRVFIRSFLSMLELVPGLGASMRVVNRLHAIRRLESERRWGEARELRSAALREVAFSRSAPLWRSEGEDLLHHRKEYAAALEAFTKAEQAMTQSTTLVGVAGPDRIFAGAAQAALLSGDTSRARAYTEKLAAIVGALARRAGNRDALVRHDEILRQLRTRLAQTPQ
jgi:hypothetical protein